jgi:hypothetical protein
VLRDFEAELRKQVRVVRTQLLPGASNSSSGVIGIVPIEIVNPGSEVEPGTRISCPPACPGRNSASVPGIYIANLCNYSVPEDLCFFPHNASLCPFGYGSDCSACPRGGFCPGGNVVVYDFPKTFDARFGLFLSSRLTVVVPTQAPAGILACSWVLVAPRVPVSVVSVSGMGPCH